jgi:hypothetical protein
MKIEYLEGDQRPLPLVRLFDFEVEEISALRKACKDLAERRLTNFALHEQPWAQPIRGCRFVWRMSQKDLGVRIPRPREPLVFEYSDEGWREVEGKLSQFVEPEANTFNWLSMEGDVAVLISMDGNW